MPECYAILKIASVVGLNPFSFELSITQNFRTWAEHSQIPCYNVTGVVASPVLKQSQFSYLKPPEPGLSHISLSILVFQILPEQPIKHLQDFNTYIGHSSKLFRILPQTTFKDLETSPAGLLTTALLFGISFLLYNSLSSLLGQNI